MAEVWDTTSGRLVHRLSGHEENLRTVSLSPDGKRALTAAWVQKGAPEKPASECAVILWDVESGREVKKFSGAYAPQFCEGGSRFIISISRLSSLSHVEGFESVSVCDSATGEVVHQFKSDGHESYVLSPSGKMLLVSKPFGVRIIYTADSGKELASFTTPSDGHPFWDEDEQGITFIGQRTSTHYSRKTDDSNTVVIVPQNMGVLCWSRDGKAALTFNSEGQIMICNGSNSQGSEKIISTFEKDESPSIIDYDLDSGKAILRFSSTAYPTKESSDDLLLVVVDLSANRLIGTMSVPRSASVFQIAGGKELAVLNRRDEIVFYDAQSLTQLRTIHLKAD